MEKEIELYEKEKQDLCTWFEKNATKYNQEKSKRFQKISAGLNSLETEWLEIQEKLNL